MLVTRPSCCALGVAVLLLVWVWPLPNWAVGAFTLHMTTHMAVVALAAPLLSFGIAGGPLDPVRRWPRAMSVLLASMIEGMVVWAWHLPALHEAARHDVAVQALEQASFLFCGLLLWISACGGTVEVRRERSLVGVLGLLFTSMHMTLLGALLALTSRQLYSHGHSAASEVALRDQQAGGIVMILLGAGAYLVGGLGLMYQVLREPSAKVKSS